MTSKRTTKIAIADDHQMFREVLTFIINKNENFEMLFDAADGKELLEKLVFHKPDVLLLDIRMPFIDGFQATKEIKAEFPKIKIIILTMYDNDDFILNLLDMGINSYLLKNTSSTEVINAIESVMDKEYYFDDRVCQVMLRGLNRKRFTKPKLKKINREIQLTTKEEEILNFILNEYSTPEIAKKLFVSTRTIETHRKNILEKFNVKNTVGLVIKALEAGFLPYNVDDKDTTRESDKNKEDDIYEDE